MVCASNLRIEELVVVVPLTPDLRSLKHEYFELMDIQWGLDSKKCFYFFLKKRKIDFHYYWGKIQEHYDNWKKLERESPKLTLND